MSDAVMGSMLGLIPVAMAGGITIGLTKEAMKIPQQVGGTEGPETPRERARRRKREKRDTTSTLWGPPPAGLM